MLHTNTIAKLLFGVVLLCTNHVLSQSNFSFRTDFDWDTFPKNTHAPECDNPSCYQFYTNDTAPYFIEEWPLVPKWVTTGEFYSGSIPIDEEDPNRTLFFIFKPAMDAPTEEVTIWLNGGPGCSSLVGFFQENGPILWQPGTQQPSRNPYTWARITNMLWVEQPVGTGFSKNRQTAHNEVGLAQDFLGFFKNWQKVFGIENFKIYITGESYAGRYVPYIAAEMLNQNDKQYFDLSGALLYDPCIGSYNFIGMNVPTYRYAKAYNGILNFNQSFLDDLQQLSEDCGFEEWMDTYLQYPPPKHQPPVNSTAPTESCYIAGNFYEAVYALNGCFNPYHITDVCPYLEDRLLYSPPYTLQPYFNRTDVKQALHAPLDRWWWECSLTSVFIGKYEDAEGPEGLNDRSPDPIQAVLPQVIEATNRVLISNADWDYLLMTNGTLLQIQNMTWNGQLGFQEAPSKDFIVPIPQYSGPQGIMGKTHYERGLMWVDSYQSGHMQPQYQPRAALRHLEWLLGRIDDL